MTCALHLNDKVQTDLSYTVSAVILHIFYLYQEAYKEQLQVVMAQKEASP